jgi:HD superfamily phosphodiesterase
MKNGGYLKIRTQPDSVYDEIYQQAKPYLDTRHNDVHTSLSYDFARRLLAHYPDADEEIVLPAILLHDVGWKMVPEKKQLNAFGPRAKDKKTKRIHEKEGVRIAGEILARLNYDENKKRVILNIIDGHDTRLEALSLNDQLVKDADKLWRFTPAGVDIDHSRFGIVRDDYIKWLDTVMADWFFTPEAKKMAHAALTEAKFNSGAKEN